MPTLPLRPPAAAAPAAIWKTKALSLQHVRGERCPEQRKDTKLWNGDAAVKLCLTAASHDDLWSTRLTHRSTRWIWDLGRARLSDARSLTSPPLFQLLCERCRNCTANRIQKGHVHFTVLDSDPDRKLIFFLKKTCRGQIVATCVQQLTHHASGGAAVHLLTRSILIRTSRPKNRSYLNVSLTCIERVNPCTSLRFHTVWIYPGNDTLGGEGGGEKDELSFIIRL